MVNKNNSPYSATITGCAFLYNEFMRILPLLMDENVAQLLKEEVLNNRLLAQRAGLLYAILKAYKLVFDFHFNVTVKRWNSVDQTIHKNDIMREFSELSSRDAFVDSWTEKTKDKCASQYLTILRQAGLLQEKTDELQPLHLEASDFEYYVRSGEDWFLEACLLYPYEVNNIKTQLS